MALNLDYTKFKTPVKVHDNCTVLDVGSGAFPRYIEIRMTGDDGARRTVIWDGSLDLAVNDLVICWEYPGSAVMRVVAVGGNDSGGGKVRVSKLWASDLSSESVVTDASDNVTINTGTLTLPSDIIHGGDTDTKISFTDDVISLDAGGLNLLKLTETTQDLVEIGDVASGGDVDINFNSGQMFLQGSSGYLGIGVTPTEILTIRKDQNGTTRLDIRNATAGASSQAQIRIRNDVGGHAFQTGITSSTFTTSGELEADNAFFQALGAIDLVIRATGAANIKFGTNATVRMYIDSAGLIGINGVTSPSTELDIGAGAIEFDEMTAPGGGAANTARLYAVDNGAGKTQLAVVFNTGAVQVLATEP